MRKYSEEYIYQQLDDLTNFDTEEFHYNKLMKVSYLIIEYGVEGDKITEKRSQLKLKYESDVMKVEYSTCIYNELYFEIDVYLGIHCILKIIKNGEVIK